MSKRPLTIVLTLLFMLTLAGCTTRHGDFTVLTNRNVGEIDMANAESLGIVEGEEMKPIIVFIPLGIPHLEDAVDDALESSGGDFMTDVAVHSSWWYIPYIYGQQKWVVRGTVWKMKGG